MSLLVAIDPGTQTGYAVFEDGKLIDCGSVHKNKGVLSRVSDGQAIIEKPKIYTPKKQKKPPKDIIELAILAGEYKALYREQGVELIVPADWKGSTPKEISNSRTLSRMTEEEKNLLESKKIAKSYVHNVLDAIGIGFYKLGRKYASDRTRRQAKGGNDSQGARKEGHSRRP